MKHMTHVEIIQKRYRCFREKDDERFSPSVRTTWIVVHSFSSCRWFVVCRDIGRTSSAVRYVYQMDLKSFIKITIGYKNRLDLGCWNAPCASLHAK